MKTAEKWNSEITTSEVSNYHLIRAIQLDAMQEGMRRAAEIVHVDGNIYVFADFNAILEGRKKEILEASNNLTINDLCATNT